MTVNAQNFFEQASSLPRNEVHVWSKPIYNNKQNLNILFLNVGPIEQLKYQDELLFSKVLTIISLVSSSLIYF